MADDPWAIFNPRAAEEEPVAAPPAEDPWAAFNPTPAPVEAAPPPRPFGMSEKEYQETIGSPEARFLTGAAKPFVGAAQLGAYGGARAAEALGFPETGKTLRGAAGVTDSMAEQFANWARESRGAAGLPPEAETLAPSTWDVPGALGEIASPVNLLAGGAAGRLVGGLGQAGTLGRAVAGAGYGLAYGATTPVTSAETEGGQKTFGEAKGEQLKSGAIGGAFAGPFIGLAGDIIGPRLAPAVRELVNRGIRLSPGQTTQGWFNRAEQGLESVPVTGAMVSEARHVPYGDFVRAAHDEALSHIGQTLPRDVRPGYEAFRHTHRAISNFYDTLHARMPTTATPQLTTDLNTVMQNSRQFLNRDSQQELHDFIRGNITERFADSGGTLSGSQMQAALAELRAVARTYTDSGRPQEKLMGRYMRDAVNAVSRLARSQHPVEAEALRGADIAYSHSKILEIAHGKNAAQAFEGQFTPAQLGQAMGQVASKHQRASGRAFYQDLVGAGKQVIPNTLPNSGTAERRLLHELLLGVGGGHALGALPHVLGGMGVTAAAYNRPAQQFIRAALTSAPGTRGPLGDFIRQHGPQASVPAVVNALMQSSQSSAEAQ
jgi:hypothetical protein